MKLFGHHIHLPFALLAVAEFCVAGLAFLLSFWFLAHVIGALDARYAALWGWTLTFGAAVSVGVTAMGLYQAKQRLRLTGTIVRLSVGVLVAAVCLALLDLIFPYDLDGELWAVSLPLTLVFLSVGRAAFSAVVDTEAFRRRVLVLGAGDNASNLLKLRRRSDQRGFRIVAFVPAPGDRSQVTDSRVVRPEGSLLEYARSLDANEIVVAMDERREGFPVRDLLDCRFAGIEIVDLLAFLERQTGKLNVELMNPAWLIFSDGFTSSSARAVATRALDLLGGLLILVLGMPFMVFVAAAILIEDGRPILFRQRRVGLMGREFVVYKFRSMVKDAEADGQARWAGTDDARITRVGRIIRKLRFDELPQVFNVLLGDMSLVGPRPERPEFVERLTREIPYYHERHCVKPGITGWAQLCYPYGSSEQDALEKLQFDLYYVKHRSLIFDLVVLLQTVEVVLWGKGAR